MNYALIINWATIFCERKRETSVETGGVIRSENIAVCSGGSHPIQEIQIDGLNSHLNDKQIN